jgi:hypothetical protein
MRLTASSGPVFFERIADMTLLRFSGDRLSTMQTVGRVRI